MLKILVIIENELNNGGGFQQALSIMLLLNKHNNDKYHFEFISTTKNNITLLNKHGIKVDYIRKKKFNGLLYYIWATYWPLYFLNKIGLLKQSPFEAECIRRKADLVYFLSPSGNAMFLDETNFIITIWDSCHRDYPEFIEVRRNHSFEQREILYNRVLKRATAIIVDSIIGQINIVTRYGIDHNRVFPIPFLPSESVRLKKHTSRHINIKVKYNLHGEYLFYPAQFWAHKNHVYIIDAIELFERQYNTLCNVLFCGSDQGNLGFILDYISNKHLKSKIITIGFVDEAEIYYLYSQALALVMPTYFGPTNIPPLEAFLIGCPVIYSDLPGLRDQVAHNGLLIDLNSPITLATAINHLLTDSEFRSKLINNGLKSIEGIDNIVWEQHDIIFSKFNQIRKCWK